MENAKFKLPAYPLPFIQHLDVIEIAIEKGEDELLLDLANLVEKHINAHLYNQNKEEFDQLFRLLRKSARNRNPNLLSDVEQKIRDIYVTITPPNSNMEIEKVEGEPFVVKKVLVENNLTKRTKATNLN